jgi:alkanesulfonate monooxygenase SsuD/methylene tetrahydromethanopterin reductase-like flavin-dependent oxidoreductase (luciferase family)
VLDATRLQYGFVTHTHPEQVAALEALGADSLWVGGHVASDNPTPEPMAQLARLSALAERATIGTAVLALPLYPPAVIAKQVADIAQFAPDRLLVGVGVGGEYQQEFRACQIDPRQRGARADESIPLLRAFWSGEEVCRSGRFYDVDRVRIRPTPPGGIGPPIVVAGRKPPAMRRAATLGDGWLPYLYSPRRYAESVQAIEQVAAEAGRTLEQFHWMCFLFVTIADDASEAKQQALKFFGATYGQEFDAMLDRVAAVGTPDQVTTVVQAFVDAGVRHLVFAPAQRGDELTTARRLATDVMPKVRVGGQRGVATQGVPERPVST